MAKKHRAATRSPRRQHQSLPPRGIFMMTEAKGPVDWQLPRPVNADLVKRITFNCFVCGIELSTDKTADNRATDEDVFAKWVQLRFNLADKSFPLQDGTQCKYSELLIPACGACNNEYMSRVEDRMARALDGGFARFSQLRKADVYLWCAKIYYGLIYHETKLSNWRAGTTTFTPRLPDEILRELSFLLDLLQGFRKRVMISGPRKLFSLLIFPLHAGQDRASYFRPALQILFPFLVLQLGSVGLICVLDDFGTTEHAYKEFFEPALHGKTLHPVQFWELAARLSYLSWIMPFAFRYMKIEGKHDMMIDYHPRSMGEHPHDPKTEAQWIAELTGLSIDVFYVDQRQRSLLFRPDRSFNELPFEDESPPEK